MKNEYYLSMSIEQILPLRIRLSSEFIITRQVMPQAVEDIVELPLIWDAITLMWSHRNKQIKIW